MDTIFMNSENSKAPDPDRLFLNITEKIQKEVINMLLYQILAYNIH